jgi:hypothetical protein
LRLHRTAEMKAQYVCSGIEIGFVIVDEGSGVFGERVFRLALCKTI